MQDNTTTATLSAFLTQAQAAALKSDEEMAQALDFTRVNVWRGIKAGQIKLPIGKVPALARALNVPAADVLAAALRDTSPELLDVIGKVWGPLNLSANEKKLLAAYRHLVAHRDHEVEPVVLDGNNIIAIITN